MDPKALSRPPGRTWRKRNTRRTHGAPSPPGAQGATTTHGAHTAHPPHYTPPRPLRALAQRGPRHFWVEWVCKLNMFYAALVAFLWSHGVFDEPLKLLRFRSASPDPSELKPQPFAAREFLCRGVPTAFQTQPTPNHTVTGHGSAELPEVLKTRGRRPVREIVLNARHGHVLPTPGE